MGATSSFSSGARRRNNKEFIWRRWIRQARAFWFVPISEARMRRRISCCMWSMASCWPRTSTSLLVECKRSPSAWLTAWARRVTSMAPSLSPRPACWSTRAARPQQRSCWSGGTASARSPSRRRGDTSTSGSRPTAVRSRSQRSNQGRVEQISASSIFVGARIAG